MVMNARFLNLPNLAELCGGCFFLLFLFLSLVTESLRLKMEGEWRGERHSLMWKCCRALKMTNKYLPFHPHVLPFNSTPSFFFFRSITLFLFNFFSFVLFPPFSYLPPLFPIFSHALDISFTVTLFLSSPLYLPLSLYPSLSPFLSLVLSHNLPYSCQLWFSLTPPQKAQVVLRFLCPLPYKVPAGEDKCVPWRESSVDHPDHTDRPYGLLALKK